MESFSQEELDKHKFYMQEAIKEAQLGLSEGGAPIGAVLVKDDKIVARGHNQNIQKKSHILHAEMDCIENAKTITFPDFSKSILYTTLSPCDMCTGTILWFKIPTVVMSENFNDKGPEEYFQSRGGKLINLDQDECKNILSEWIQNNQHIWKGSECQEKNV